MTKKFVFLSWVCINQILKFLIILKYNLKQKKIKNIELLTNYNFFSPEKLKVIKLKPYK